MLAAHSPLIRRFIARRWQRRRWQWQPAARRVYGSPYECASACRERVASLEKACIHSPPHYSRTMYELHLLSDMPGQSYVRASSRIIRAYGTTLKSSVRGLFTNQSINPSKVVLTVAEPRTFIHSIARTHHQDCRLQSSVIPNQLSQAYQPTLYIVACAIPPSPTLLDWDTGHSWPFRQRHQCHPP